VRVTDTFKNAVGGCFVAVRNKKDKRHHLNAHRIQCSRGTPKRKRGSDGAPQEDIGTSAENDYDSTFGIQVGGDTFAIRTVPETPSIHHDEESITFYDLSAKTKT
jgi:hypothetical protein